jgi:tetratricopeptide (TPR) repeat protein
VNKVNPSPTPESVFEPAADIPALLRAALTHHAGNRPDQAKPIYLQILDRDPDHAQALGMLALILSDEPDEAAAQTVLLRHLALRPDDGASLHRLGRLRAGQGDDGAAAVLFQRAALSLPALAPIHNDLGVSLHRLGRTHEALSALDQAIALDPGYAAAHANRASLLTETRRFAEAFEAQLAALAHAASAPVAMRASLLGNLALAARKADALPIAEAALRAELQAGRIDPYTLEQLALALEYAGRPAEALAVRNDLARVTGVHGKGEIPGAEPAVLVLGAVGAGHVPTRYLLDAEAFPTLTVSLLSPDQPDAPLGSIDIDILAAADVVFSTLADVDHDGGQFDAAAALCAYLGKPVINPPRAIGRTARDHASVLFDGITGMETPAVRRLAPADLAALPITAPVLVRPAGDHGGENLTLLGDVADRDAYLARDPAERLLVSPFHDFRSPDGYWRKYRLIFVDRQVFPYHLAIGEDWLVHYWRADMQRSAWKMAEEQRFLEDWRAVFGPLAAQAVEEAAGRLDLDYGGMDCALLPDGRALLFEANACILVHLDESPVVFPYKHRHVPPIREAFSRLVRRRAGRAAGP